MNEQRPNPWLNPSFYELDRMSPEQRRVGRQIMFWVLLVYLELIWFSFTALRLLIPAAVLGLLTLAARKIAFGQRPSFVALHGALLFAMLQSAIETESWLLIADFGALGALVVLELIHRRVGLLVTIAIEHIAAMILNPWSAIGSMNDPRQPLVGAVALFRLFAVIMLTALAIRIAIAPKIAPAPEPEPKPAKPSRPLTVAEWEARHGAE